EGEIRQIGAPWEIYRRPNSLYVARFIGEANALPARIVASDAGMVTCETPLGSLLIRKENAGSAEGSSGHVIIRPEDVMMVEAGAADRNCCQGTIAASILLGPQIELRMQVGEVGVRACVSSLLAGRYTPGQPVVLHLPSDRLTWVES